MTIMQEIISGSEARKLGLKSYFTGKPCKHGHIAKRATANGICLECARIKEGDRRKANPEKARQRDQIYTQNHREEAKARAKAWRENNPERHRQMQKQYYDDNKEKWTNRRKSQPEQTKANKRAWREKNKEKINTKERLKYPEQAKRLKANTKRWRKNNKEAHNAHNRNRNAIQRQSTGQHTSQDIQDILSKQGFKCDYCDCDLNQSGYHVDHIIPLSRGGSNGPENLCACCPPCNMRKHTMTGDEYRAFLQLT